MEKCILFVDDEPMILKVLETVFYKNGFAPRCSLNGDNALDILVRDHVRVCFVDLRMPGMDGLTLCTRIKQLDPTACVYALSAFIDSISPDQYRKVGFDGKFSKPFKIDELLKAANVAFEKLERGTTA